MKMFSNPVCEHRVIMLPHLHLCFHYEEGSGLRTMVFDAEFAITCRMLFFESNMVSA